MELEDEGPGVLSRLRARISQHSTRSAYRDLQESEESARHVAHFSKLWLSLSAGVLLVTLVLCIVYLVNVLTPRGHNLLPEATELALWIRRLMEAGAMVLTCLCWWHLRKHRVTPPSGSFFSSQRVYLLVLALGTVLWHGTVAYELWDEHRAEAVLSALYALGALVQLALFHFLGNSELSLSFRSNKSVLHLLTFSFLLVYNLVLCVRDLAVDYRTGASGPVSFTTTLVMGTTVPGESPSLELTALSILALAAMIDFRLHCGISAAEQLMHRIKRHGSSRLAVWRLFKCPEEHATSARAFKRHLQQHTVHQGSDFSLAGVVVGLVPACALSLLLNFGGGAHPASIVIIVLSELGAVGACLLILLLVRPHLHALPVDVEYPTQPATGVWELVYFYAIAALYFVYAVAVHAAKTDFAGSAAILTIYLEVVAQVLLISVLIRGEQFMVVQSRPKRALAFACLHFLLVLNIAWSVIYLVTDPELLDNDLDSAGVAVAIHFHFLAATLCGQLIAAGFWSKRSLEDTRSEGSWWKRLRREEVLRFCPEPSSWFTEALEFGEKATGAERELTAGQFEMVHRTSLWESFMRAVVDHGLLDVNTAEGDVVSFLVENETLLEDLFGVPWVGGISKLLGRDPEQAKAINIAASLFKANELLPLGMVAVATLSDTRVTVLGCELGIPLVSAGGSTKQAQTLQLGVEEGEIRSELA